MKNTVSKFIQYNNTKTQSFDENGNLLNGVRFHADSYDKGKSIILRFKNGLLDGDVFDNNGNFVMQKPAVETEGHIEYWREGKLHRDNNEPAIYSDGFRTKEYWENGNRLEYKE